MKGRRVAGRAAVMVALACGCEKSRTEAPAERAVSSAVVGVDAAQVPRASAAEGAGPSTAWSGTYRTSVGDLYIPPDWKDVHWKVKETSIGLGEGTVAIHVDPATGRVLGTLGGPLGPATIDGLASDGKLSATILRNEPSDEGFTGTMVGTIANDRVDGKMYVSLASASAIRVATFAMVPDGDQQASH